MSKLSTARAQLKSILESRLPEFTVFTKWNVDGLQASKAIQINGYYYTENNTTEGVSRSGIKFDIYIMVESVSCLGDDMTTEEEEVENTLETILNLSLRPENSDIQIYTDMNRGNPCKAVDFTVKLK